MTQFPSCPAFGAMSKKHCPSEIHPYRWVRYCFAVCNSPSDYEIGLDGQWMDFIS